MKTGLVLGKFHPLHNGHIALVEFSLQYCDELIILLCSSDREKIPGLLRQQWLFETFGNNSRIHIEHVVYDESELPNSSVSSLWVSQKWATYISKSFSGIDIFFSSEPYGEYVAGFLNISHKCFDQHRVAVPVSASAILANPFSQWRFIAPAARPFFVKKICISGSESTGKSTLTQNLAQHFDTAYVPEMAREIIGKTEEVVFEDLMNIATLHAKAINEKAAIANKLLFCDTDINITKSYSKFLFGRTLHTPTWVDDANQYDLHIFLETDCPYVQDGTRLSEEDRNRLSNFHKLQLSEAGIKYISVGGNWDERHLESINIINRYFAIY